jgi:hypothetical protein
MKKLYAIAFIALFTSKVYSQDLEAIHPTFHYYGPNTTDLVATVEIRNNSSQNFDVIVENYSRLLTTNHFSYFCWVLCYDTSVYLSPDPMQLAAGATTSAFYDHVIPNNINGDDQITYRWYDKNGLSDTLEITFHYHFGTAGIIEMNSSSLSIQGPNPANTHTKISYLLSGKKNARLVVTNMLGSKVKEINLSDNQNTLELSVADLISGVYVYSLVIDEKIISSKKLIVSHK